jgi:hypothetical protein
MHELPSLEYLDRLYLALQKLNRSLLVANSTEIFKAVEEVSSAMAADSTGEPEADTAKRYQLVERIVHLQRTNQSLCANGLKMIHRLANLVGVSGGYNGAGQLQEAALPDLNVSA